MAETLTDCEIEKTNGQAETDENEQEQLVPPPELPLKHPLEHTWCLWYNTNTVSQEKWNENQLKIHSFSTVEDFWCLFHHLKPPSELDPGHDYAVFKSGIPPVWEHPANKHGGRWLLIMDRARKRTDEFWLNSILLMIGENFTHNSEICGIVVTVRVKNKIGIWTKNGSNQTAILEIGRKIKENVIGRNFRMFYHKHNTSVNIHEV